LDINPFMALVAFRLITLHLSQHHSAVISKKADKIAKIIVQNITPIDIEMLFRQILTSLALTLAADAPS